MSMETEILNEELGRKQRHIAALNGLIDRDEALLRQALEALESSMYPQKKQNVAIDALRERLGEKA